ASQLAEANAKQRSPDKPVNKPAETELRDALADYYPSHSLPTLLSLAYLNTPKNEMLLTSSIQISTAGLSYGDDGKQKATVRLAGVILNEHTPLAPGIYQVRVAARDENSGNVGSAMQWIVIPDLGTRQLRLSSVLLGGKVLENSASQDATPQVQFSVDHRFAQSSPLSYWIFVYNAKH